MNKFFGIAALAGLIYFWLVEKPLRVHARRTLTASWYGERERGKLMANGKPFDPDKFTCASWDYSLGTILKIYRPGVPYAKSFAVKVTDRGPAKRLLKTRQIDLSHAAFQALAPLKLGLIQVTVEVL